MRARRLMLAAIMLVLGWSAAAQPAPSTSPSMSPSPGALAAARSLAVTMKVADQANAMLPAILLGIRPALVQDRPEIERDYEAMAAAASAAYKPYVEAMLDGVAAIYASAFSVEELHQIEAFYRLPAGQKWLATSSALNQQRDALLQDISRKAADELKSRLTEALRAKGHKL